MARKIGDKVSWNWGNGTASGTINLTDLTFYDNTSANGAQPNEADFIVQGGTLNFVGGTISAHLTDNNRGTSSVTIKSSITGSPDAQISDNQHRHANPRDDGEVRGYGAVQLQEVTEGARQGARVFPRARHATVLQHERPPVYGRE